MCTRAAEQSKAPVPDLRIKVFLGREGLDSISGEWRRLVLGIPNHRFFQLPEWHKSYLSSLEIDPASVAYFVAYRADKMVAVLPLRHSRRRIHGLILRTLGLIAHSHITLGDFAFAQHAENATLMQTFVDWLRAQREFAWDVLLLDRVPDRSAIAFALKAAPPSLLLCTARGSSSYIPCEQPYETATSAISGSFKRNLRRLARRAAQTAPLSYLSVHEHVELTEALPRFFALEASGWKGGEGTAIDCDESLVMFYRGLVEEFGSQGQCCINFLRLGDTDVAAQFCLRVGGATNLLKIGFDEAHAAIAPGNLIMERTIQDCCENTQIRYVSFVTSPSWDHVWKPLSEVVWEYQVFNNTSYGRALHGLVRGKRFIENRARLAKARIRRPSSPDQSGD
jgi:CelD/BcsL family acetyltransferase involved in cellulose biosynthesis